MNGNTPQVWSIFRDHLGTITHLKNGSTIKEYSFDAYGRRRDKDSWSYTLTSEPALFADRGFTGHEHIKEFGLINMNLAIKRVHSENIFSTMPNVSQMGEANGRLYDPLVGRFLNPDNFVQQSVLRWALTDIRIAWITRLGIQTRAWKK